MPAKTEARSPSGCARCGREVADLPPQASDVIQECGFLPLPLAMIGAQLRAKQDLCTLAVIVVVMVIVYCVVISPAITADWKSRR
jgi:hypothetical protein